MRSQNIPSSVRDKEAGDLPAGKMKRNLFDLSNQHLSTFNIGRLIPIMNKPVLPGDVLNLRHEIQIRFLPMYWPIMSFMDLSVHYFYVPWRVLFSDFEECLKDKDNEFPLTRLDLGGYYGSSDTNLLNTDSLGCYMGLPTEGTFPIQDTNPITIWRYLAYLKIYDYYYRNQSIQEELLDFDVEHGVQSVGTYTYPDINRHIFDRPKFRNWGRDYFTTALPTAQAGEDVLVPLFDENQSAYLKLNNGSGTAEDATWSANGTLSYGSLGSPTWAQLDTESLNNDAAHLREFRLAAQLLEYYEMQGRSGYHENYRDTIIARFGIDPMPGVVDEPVYIGGSKSGISVQDVMSTADILNSSDEVSTPLGDYAGKAQGLQSSKGHRFYAKEWGTVIGIASIRPNSMYQQGMERYYRMRNTMDLPWPEFAHIGDQEINNEELLWRYNGTGVNENSGTWGYQPRYEEWRQSLDTVAGQMRNTFTDFHLGRIFSDLPGLTDAFLQMNDVRTNDVFKKVDNTDHEVFANIVNDVKIYRNLPKFGIPKL